MPRKSKHVVKKQTIQQPIPPTVSPMVTPQAQTQVPTLNQETIQKLQQYVADLIVLGGELGMEIACSDCKAILNCSIVDKAKEIVKVVKNIRELLRQQMK